MINRQTGEIYWKLGAPPLSGQHAPTILPNGHVLLFDNGPHRLDQTFPFSRVLEIDPATKDIVWKYQETPVSNFFSPRISNAQRLPNGNTLINEGWFGRFFEVTPKALWSGSMSIRTLADPHDRRIKPTRCVAPTAIQPRK